MRLRTAVIGAAIFLLSCAGTLGLYLGVMSAARMLRPTVATDVPGGQPRRSVMAMDSARTTALAPSSTDTASTQPPSSVAALDQAAAPPSQPAIAPQPAAPADAEAATAPPSVVAMTYKPQRAQKGGPASSPRGVTILQLGDSHTSADFLTGELRRQLQATYGNGGAGYVTAGKPHIGVISSALKINLSQGWTYKALQKSDDVGEFWMSGFNSVATKAGETLSFTTERPLTFDVIEIEAVRKPGGGAIDIRLDGALEGSFDLAAAQVEPVVIRLVPDRAATDRVREIMLTTRSEGVVSISSVAIYNTRSGLTYNSVGYPGATIDILNKLDGKLFVNDLQRLNPHIVVLSFGTNEASKENLDIKRYAERYERVVNKIRAALPSAAVVLVGPPEGEELAPHCKEPKAREAAICHRAPETTASAAASDAECAWKTLPKLNDVREAQRQIAQRNGLVYWNWASIMPKECGAHRWLTQSPPLMAKDHIHFTIAGYKKSAASFLSALVPVIEKFRSRPDAVSND